MASSWPLCDCDGDDRIAADGFSNEDLRVGGPYLCSIPLLTIHLPYTNPLYWRVYGRGGEEGRHPIGMIYGILNQNHINYDVIDLVFRQSRFDPEPHPIPTIVVHAFRGTVDNVWLDTARQIRALLVQRYILHVSVEITDRRAYETPMNFPVLTQDPIFQKWDFVLADILQEIDLTDIYTIACYRRGRNAQPANNPPTVLVLVTFKSKRHWEATRELIFRVLNRFDLPMVAVEIAKDMVSRTNSRGTAFRYERLSDQVTFGQFLSLQSSKDVSGPLAGCIELQHPVTDKWHAYALTCFHCINPRDEDVDPKDLPAMRKMRKHGLPFVANENSEPSCHVSQRLAVIQPSNLAKKERIKKLQEVIDGYKEYEFYSSGLYMHQAGMLHTLSESEQKSWSIMHEMVQDKEKEIETIQKFFQNSEHHLGHVVAASGFRREKLHTLGSLEYPTNLDWALIDLHSGRSTSYRMHNGMYLVGTNDCLQNPLESHGCDLSISSPYRESRGKFSQLKVAYVCQKIVDGQIKHIPTLEWSIVGTEKDVEPFSLCANKGSLVYTPREMATAGMVFAVSSVNDISYFTRLDDLFDDILKHTPAKDILLGGPSCETGTADDSDTSERAQSF